MEQNLIEKRESQQENDHSGGAEVSVAFQLNVKEVEEILQNVEDILNAYMKGLRCERGKGDDNDLVIIWTENVKVANDIIEKRPKILELLGVEKVLVGVHDSTTFADLRGLISENGEDIKTELQTKHTRFHYMQEVKHQKEIIGNLQVENKVLQEQLEEEKLKNRLIESQYIEELKLSRSVAKALIEKDVSFQLKMGELTDEAEYLKCQLQKSERRALSIKENNEHEELDTASKEVTHEEESGIISPHEVTELANGNLSIGRFGQLFQACYAGRPVLVEKLVSPPKMKLDYLRQEQLIRRYQRSCVLRCDSIVEVYGYCSHSDEDIFWLVMECMARGCLSDVLGDTLLTLTWGERNQLALDVGRGIDFLHSRDMLLRNTCCANILVSEDLRAKICNTGDVKTTGTAEREYPISPEPYHPPEILIEEGSNSFYNLEAEAYGFGKIMEAIAKGRDVVNDWNLNTKLAIIRGEDVTLPDDCPTQYKDAALGLTRHEPSERLTVRDAVELLAV